MKLILLGGGITKNSSIIAKNIIALTQSTIYLVDFANIEEHISKNKYFNQYNKVFLEQNKPLKQYNSTDEISAIYLGGGDTFQLKKKCLESNLHKQIKKIKQLQDGIIIGNSAGSILMGNTIEFAHDGNKNLVETNEGFSVIDYVVFPHYKISQEHEIKNIQKKYSKIILLPENSALLIDKNIFKNIGEEDIIIIEHNKKQILKKEN